MRLRQNAVRADIPGPSTPERIRYDTQAVGAVICDIRVEAARNLGRSASNRFAIPPKKEIKS